ncbi:hypothetical protein [uncultured Piscinibacter sp.]|uniref:hypothetical protein n=1 Tax=uncultured Piscinibacter sp. TaxID=1131835 RepID=UPI00262F9C04|nr:hypothetical protein [uncultured Piscinibacter sp.]
MNPQRHAAHPSHEDFDPHWWLVPAAIVAVTLLIALLGLAVHSDATVVAPMPQISPEVPIVPDNVAEVTVPDAGSVTYAQEPFDSEQPPTF